MTAHLRLQLYWPGRTDTVSVMARQLAAFLAGIAPLHPGLEGFLCDGTPASSAVACEEALLRHAIQWHTGAQPRTSYQARFYVDRNLGSKVAFTLTCGIEPLGLGPIFTPNRLEFLVRADVGDERASRPVLEAVLRRAVTAFEPDWAFVGSDNVPQAPKAVFSDGTPVIGWMTYLRAAFPPVPRSLPEPAVVYPVASLGTLIVAHPELFHDDDEAQRAAMERVRVALEAAGVLVPPSALRPAR
jgi:hypothetical protein